MARPKFSKGVSRIAKCYSYDPRIITRLEELSNSMGISQSMLIEIAVLRMDGYNSVDELELSQARLSSSVLLRQNEPQENEKPISSGPPPEAWAELTACGDDQEKRKAWRKKWKFGEFSENAND